MLHCNKYNVCCMKTSTILWLCVICCMSLFVLLFFFFWPWCCLSVDLQILIPPLVSSSSRHFYIDGVVIMSFILLILLCDIPLCFAKCCTVLLFIRLFVYWIFHTSVLYYKWQHIMVVGNHSSHLNRFRAAYTYFIPSWQEDKFLGGYVLLDL
jgi:hypothetical protein